MIYSLIIFTFLPAWFVGPLPVLQGAPNTPPIYYSGPSLVFPIQTTPDGHDRVIVIVDPPGPTTPSSSRRLPAMPRRTPVLP